jgi:hypothetical protein
MNEQTSLDRARAYFSQAQRQLNHAKEHQNAACDVCGPGGGHTFHTCYEVATNAMKSLLSLQNRNLAQTIDLKLVVAEAAGDLSGFESAVNMIDRMLACGTRRASYNSEPDPGDVAEAIQLTEQFVALVGAHLPKEVLT